MDGLEPPLNEAGSASAKFRLAPRNHFPPVSGCHQSQWDVGDGGVCVLGGISWRRTHVGGTHARLEDLLSPGRKRKIQGTRRMDSLLQ